MRGCLSPSFVQSVAIVPARMITHRLWAEADQDTGASQSPMRRTTVSSKYTTTDVNTWNHSIQNTQAARKSGT